MSNPIEHWKTIRLENLVVPFEFNDGDIEWGRNNTVFVDLSEDAGLKGVVADDLLTVKSIELHGTRSGSYGYPHLLKLLKRSTGYLEARLIWEDGFIERLISNNGEIQSRED